MNCRDIEPLLLAERDGVLTPQKHAELAAHVAGCPACRRERAIYGEAVSYLKTDAANITVPDADKEWRTIRAQLPGENAKPARKRPLAPVIWFTAPLAAAAALALGLFVIHPTQPAAEAPTATIAYVDRDSGWLVVWAVDTQAGDKG
ncbi:MAG: zf-HC2 domain-containing protein [Lacunisphaera sp.]|jgi:anti-sigma factor RsiW|nr:zf-HC2 domain-containing protein [Lacunisphaera sp.]